MAAATRTYTYKQPQTPPTKSVIDNVLQDANERKMSKSSKIRALYDAGVPVADIARTLDITYQHVYNTLRWSGMLPPPNSRETAA